MPELNRLSLTEDDRTGTLTDVTPSASDPENGILVFLSYVVEIFLSFQTTAKKKHDWIGPFIWICQISDASISIYRTSTFSSVVQFA